MSNTTRTVWPVPSVTGWPPSGLAEVLPVAPPYRAGAPLRASRIGALVLVRPRAFPSALRPGVLVSASSGAVYALVYRGAAWVFTLPWAWAWRGLGLPCPVTAVWVPLPRRGARSVLWGLLHLAAEARRA